MDSLGLPIHSGYYIEDLRAAASSAAGQARGCDAAFIQLEGQQGITETRVSEVPPRGVLPPVRLAFDEVVYVVQGRGATTIWSGGGAAQELRVAGEQHVPAAAPPLPPVQQYARLAARRGCSTTTTSRCCCRPVRIRRRSSRPIAATPASRCESMDLEAMYAEPSLTDDEPAEDVVWKRRRRSGSAASSPT